MVHALKNSLRPRRRNKKKMAAERDWERSMAGSGGISVRVKTALIPIIPTKALIS